MEKQLIIKIIKIGDARYQLDVREDITDKKTIKILKSIIETYEKMTTKIRTKAEFELIEMVENAIELRAINVILTIGLDGRVVRRSYVCDCKILEKLEDYNEKR